jgi:hypothetical protein
MSKKFALLAIGVSVSLVAPLLVALPARAECRAPDGTVVPEGGTYGPYVCLPGGVWKTR